jgi:non-specific serine/threonine protein kinase
MSQSERGPLEEAAARARGRHPRNPSGIPVSLTSFVERSEVDELKALLTEHRLLTITGSPGIGKTRIAVEVARRVEGLYDEACFVDLLPLLDGDLVASQIAVRLDVRLQGDDGLSGLVHHLRSRRTLLVIDNCEHIVADAVSVIGTLLAQCPLLTVFATSREALAHSAEFAYRLPSMNANAATELFVARAQQADLTWYVDPERLVIVADICKNLGWIPLAIELAASRVSSLGLVALRTRLGTGLHLTGNRDLPLRHQTMTAAIAWSYDLLNERERLLLCRSSVAAGGFTLEWAEQVCAGDALPVEAVADTLSWLVQKCLINVDHVGISARYRFLESIQRFAQQRLSDWGEFDGVVLRELAWLERKAAALSNQPSTDSVWSYRVELDNVREAVRWVQSHGDHSSIRSAANILIGFSRVYSSATREFEPRMLGLNVLERLNEDEDPELVARLICSLATHITATERMALLPRAIPLLKQTGQLDRAAYLHAKIAEIECSRGNLVAAGGHVAKAQALLATKELRNSQRGLTTAMTCAYVCSLLGEFNTARRWLTQAEIPVGEMQEVEAQIVLAEIEFRGGHVEKACQVSKKLVDTLGSYPDMDHLAIMVFGNHARYLLQLGAEGAAEEALRVSLHRAVDIRDAGFLYVISSLARHASALTARAGRADLAARLLGACDATDQRNGRPSIKDTAAEDLAAKSISSHLSQERAATLRAQGASEDLYELIEEYLAQPAAADNARAGAEGSTYNPYKSSDK